MASQNAKSDLSKVTELFDIERGPSFKDLINAAFFDPAQFLEFRFKDETPDIKGTLVAYVPGGEQFCLVALEHHPGRGGTEIAYFFYATLARVGRRIYPKSLEDFLEYGK